MIAAGAVAIRTASPAEPSFGSMLERVTLEARGAGDAPVACGVMAWEVWRRVVVSIGMVAAGRAIGGMAITFELSREATMPDGVRTADGLRLAYAENGLLAIEFLDREGAVFAVAHLDAEQLAQFIGQGCDLIEIVSKGGLAVTPCAGAA